MSAGLLRARPVIGRASTSRVSVRSLPSMTALGLAYAIGALVGFQFGLVGHNASAIWPPAGIAVAALMLGGRRLWPGIYLGALVANLANGEPPLGAAIVSVGSVVEPLVAVALLRRWAFRPQLDRLRDVPILVLGGALVPALAGASVGVGALAVTGGIAPPNVVLAWVSWALGDGLSVLVIGSMLLTWWSPLTAGELRKHALEVVLALAAIGAVAIVLFFDVFDLRALGQSVAFPLIPLVVWIAFRIGPRGNALAALAYSVIAVAATQQGVGPFVGTTREGTLLYLGVFIGLVAISGAAVAAVVAERGAVSAERGAALLELAAAAQAAASALRQLQAVEGIARLLAEAGPTPAAFDAVVDVLAETFGFTHPSIWMGNGRSLRLLAHRGYLDPALDLRVTSGVMARAVATRQTQYVADVARDPDFIRADPDVCSEIAAPLQHHDRLLGVLNVESVRRLEVRDLSAVAVAAESIAAALALALERQRLADAQRVAAIGDWELDVETGAVRGSDELCRIAGLSPGAFPSDADGLLSLVHPDDRIALCAAEHTALSAHDGTAQLDARILRPDGSHLVTHMVVQARHDASGRPERLIGTCQDVTSQRVLELERARLGAVVEQSPQAVVITDPDARIVYVNGSFEESSGYRRDEVIGRHPRLLRSESTPQEVYADPSITLGRGMVWSGDLPNRRRDGSLHTESAIILPIRGAASEVTGYAAIMRDVTRERELEAQLGHALRMETVGQLAGGVAHDFNNLLTAIRGYAELIRRDPDGPSVARDLDEIVVATDRASHLTRQLLSFSRRQVVQPTILDPAAVVRSLAPMLRRLIGEHIELVDASTPRVGHVLVDQGQLEQVVINLAVNARDAMEEGGRLTIGVDLASPPDPLGVRGGAPLADSMVRILVTDIGTGMDAVTRARIFEPFFTTKPVGQGTGLGLATVFGIVRQAGGSIDVDSVPGRGTSMHVYLPRVDPASSGAAAEDGVPEPDHVPRGSERILLTEDEPAVRELARRVLVSLGYRVTVAGNGDEALSIANEPGRPFDLLVTDVVMPGMPGPELARKVAIAQPGIGVLLISGYAPLGSGADAGRAAGQFLAKPFSAAVLGRAVRHALGAARR